MYLKLCCIQGFRDFNMTASAITPVLHETDCRKMIWLLCSVVLIETFSKTAHEARHTDDDVTAAAGFSRLHWHAIYKRKLTTMPT